MSHNPHLRYLKIFLSFLFVLIIFYNFKTAYSYRYDAEGDASNFLSLGLTLAETQKYGHLDIQGGLLNTLREKRISKEDYEFLGHSTWRPPVWPFLIGTIFLIFGYNLTYLLIFKFLLHLLGTIIFYKTLKLFKFKEIIIVVGTFLYGISPAWQLYSRVFLSEPITLFFITLWLYLLIRFIQDKSGFLPQALVGGLLILSHPYYVFLPFSTWFILYLRKKIKLKLLLASSVICASIVSIWIVRNIVVLDTNKLVLTTSSGAVMAKGWNLKVPEEHTNTKGDLADEELVLLNYEYDRGKVYGEVERMQLYKNATINFIRSHPDMILPIVGTKLLSAFNPFPETPKPGILETGRWLFQFFALLSLVYILIFSRNKLLQSLAVGLILSTIGITILTYSGFRFRMPQVGLELLFIAYVLNNFVKKRRSLYLGSSPFLD